MKRACSIWYGFRACALLHWLDVHSVRIDFIIPSLTTCHRVIRAKPLWCFRARFRFQPLYRIKYSQSHSLLTLTSLTHALGGGTTPVLALRTQPQAATLKGNFSLSSDHLVWKQPSTGQMREKQGLNWVCTRALEAWGLWMSKKVRTERSKRCPLQQQPSIHLALIFMPDLPLQSRW